MLTTMATKQLSVDQLGAWRALYRADTLLFTHLDNTLRSKAGMTYFEHEVLQILDQAGGRSRAVVDAVVSTFFADQVSGDDLRRAARILDKLADANPTGDGFDCGL